MEARLFECEVKELVKMPFHNIGAIAQYLEFCSKTMKQDGPDGMDQRFKILMCIDSDPNRPLYQMIHNGTFATAKEFCNTLLKEGAPVKIVALP